LNFSDFSTIFKRIYKFTGKIRKHKLRFAKGSLVFSQNPLETQNYLRRGPWPELGTEAAAVGVFPARRGSPAAGMGPRGESSPSST
jgi:hypothetical protein